jgi:hypothetical protein
MQEFDLKAFSDASFGPRLRCCDDRFFFHIEITT